MSETKQGVVRIPVVTCCNTATEQARRRDGLLDYRVNRDSGSIWWSVNSTSHKIKFCPWCGSALPPGGPEYADADDSSGLRMVKSKFYCISCPNDDHTSGWHMGGRCGKCGECG